ncbi:hypothetical protein GVAV_000209 [Gurleya vavrai]
MLSEENINALKLEIDNILLKKDGNKRKVQYNQMIEYLTDDQFFFQNVSHDIYGEKHRAFSIKIQGEELYALNNLLLVYNEGLIMVFSYDEEFQMRKIREIRTHLLIFIIQTMKLSYETRCVFYNLILTLVDQKIKKIDKLIEDFLYYIDIDNLKAIIMINNMIVCICKNDNYIAYNNRLVRCNLEIDPKDLNIIEKNKKVRYIECEKMVICIRKNEILIDYREKSFVELINVKNVRKCTCWGDHLFLLMKKKILAIKFF